ncbi:MAG: winged helix-turn-helix transcriptional regulator [Gemmatimonadetes bacterium]|nr:winged helix-turn-helix transcriptional regulator [Gemmatimonadota bacterium]
MKTTQRELARAAHRFHALSDETRLQVVEFLARGERCVCELQDAVGVAQSRLSFHLKVLRDAGLVSDRRQGRWVYYSMRPEALAAMRTFLEEHFPAGARRERAGCICQSDCNVS